MDPNQNVQPENVVTNNNPVEQVPTPPVVEPTPTPTPVEPEVLPTPEVTSAEKPKKKLSTGAKIAIGCGGVLVLGLIVVVLLVVLGVWGAREALQNANEVAEQYYEDEGYYTNDDFDFMIKAPTDWDEDDSGSYGAVVFFYDPDVDTEDGQSFATNINVLVTDVTEYCDNIEDCRDLMLESVESYSADAEVLDTEFVDVNGSDGYIITANYSQGGFTLRGTQLIVLEGNLLYTVTGTSLRSTADNYTEIFDDSLMSFELN